MHVSLVKMRSSWIRVALNPMSDVVIRERRGRFRHRGEATGRQRQRLECSSYGPGKKLGRGKGTFFP